MVSSTLISRHSHGGLIIGWIQRVLIVSLGFLSSFSLWSRVESTTNQQDINALIELHTAWNGNPFSWDTKRDPCDTRWLGVHCDATQTRVTHLLLINQGLEGTLPPAIGDLTSLTDLDLSSNPKLGGSLPVAISNLINIETLYLQFCNFWGPIPPEIGNLTTLQYFGLTQNAFSGPLPETIGFLSGLIWLDVSSNNLNGSLPDSATSSTGLGLGNLTLVQHFHLQNNSFSGSIPTSIFNTEMRMIHLLLNDNDFNGSIPANVGNLLHLQIMRFDYNALTGPIPSGISTMQGLTTLQLDNNQLSGQLLDLSNCTNLQLLYLGNNDFTIAPFPTWIESLSKLYLLSIDSANLIGNIPADFFNSSHTLSNVSLAANSLNGTLDLSLASTTLQYVNVTNNQLDGFVNSNHILEVMLGGNPFCTNNGAQCLLLQSGEVSPTGSTSAPNCSNSCQSGYAINPKQLVNCQCVRPVIGSLEILATMFPILTPLDLSFMEEKFANGLNKTTLPILDAQVVVNPSSTVVQATILVFPPNPTDSWSPTNASLISYGIKNLGITFPGTQGTLAIVCDYNGAPYAPQPANSGLNAGAKAGIAVMVVVFVVAISLLGLYAIKQRRRANEAEKANKPFAAWMATREGCTSAHIPQLKGARWFSLDEIRKCTNNFSKNNEIGEGGYGKVYQAYLVSGEKVAIKRAREDSLQGAAEFKNEIELLSRVHHRNLVSLIGFCFEEGEQMLVYEFVANGTLQECISGKTGIQMSWERRISLALCSARGIAYLHTEANPAIIHGDIKSSNILLDDKLVAKVADFGLSKLVPIDDTVAVPSTSAVRGTLGYLDPHYYMTNTLTHKSDVYSFGVVLLELLTGRRPIQGSKSLISEMRMALARGMSEVKESMVDRELQEYPPQALEKLLELALACVRHNPDDRPSMFEVVKEIESLSEPPLAMQSFNLEGKYAQTEEDKLFSPEQKFSSTFDYSGSFAGMGRLLEFK